jgi:UDP-N-acetylmuramoylalanine--D-glutamate ligase
VRFSDLRGKRVLVIGTGREAQAFARVARPDVAELLAIDEVDGESAHAWRATWGDRVPLTISSTAAEIAPLLDMAVTSPGVPPHHPLRTSLATAGVPVTMPTDLWLGEYSASTTGITGSKGKSTTSALVHALLVAHGVHSELGGNIGNPLFALPAAERYVAELSSYQSSTVSKSPDVVVLTSLFPEHLDWHGDVERYFSDKLNLVGHGPRRIIVNGDDERLMMELHLRYPDIVADTVGDGSTWELDPSGTIRRAGEEFVPADGWRLRGRHNVRNAALALAAVEASGVDPDPVVAPTVLREFSPLEHRLEPIADSSGLTFVDDSLSTAPQATVEALDAYRDVPVVLLIGGQDRGVDYAPLAARLTRHPIVALIGLPGSGADLIERLAGTGIAGELAADMADAVAIARRLAPPNGVVLLSPAAPSYGTYVDYRERSAAFRRAIAASLPG